MMNTALALMVGLSAGQYPDTLDHLRGGAVVPQVGLLLDRSCSMGWGTVDTDCNWYASAYRGGNDDLNKKDMMKATLVGCESATDGILDQWADRVNFSVYEFGSSVYLTTPFDSTLSALESGVLGIPSSGSTRMTRGLRDHGLYFDSYFTNANTLDCRPNFLVMLSDGNPNGGASTFSQECSVPPTSTYVSSSQPWFGSQYLADHTDLLCSVPGDQQIKTYTIGFGQPGDFSPSNLQNIAAYGGGEYFYASDVDQLSVAFESIIGTIVAKSAIFFAPIAIQTGSMFSENYAYAASFKPVASGPWRGNVKKYCVTPPVLPSGLYDGTVDSCLFVAAPNGYDLLTNPTAMDLWTGVRSLAADEGGAGAALFTRIGAVAGGAPVSPYWSHRNVLSYRDGDTDYSVVNPSSWSEADTWSNGCDRYRLINHLHGYTYDADCASGDPVAVARWSVGDPIGFSPTLLKYAKCEDAAGVPVVGACYLVSGMNDGMVHFIDAATGDESTALIPTELWTPGDYANAVLGDVQDQPNVRRAHEYYVDGDARLFHEDNNADGIIQSTEKAVLSFGLGRGGRTSYLMPVSQLPGGVPTAANNPLYPLRPEPGTALADLQDRWASPWLGLAKVGAATKRVAVFGSGHVAELDLTEIERTAGAFVPPVGPVDVSNAITVSCGGDGNFADFNGLDKSTWCSSVYYPSCQATAAKPCYDPSGLPTDISTAPLTYNDGVQGAAALRVYFQAFDMSSDDVVRIEDGSGNLVGTYTRAELDKRWTPWVYDDEIVIRRISNGVDTLNRGFRVNRMQWVPDGVIPPGTTPPTPSAPAGSSATFRLGIDHHPSVFFMDLDAWNGATPQKFASTISDAGMLLRFTNDCEGTAGGRCFDSTDFPDLAHMKCPITAEVSAYTEADRLRAIYVGDECAQIWKFWTADGGSNWQARRLINLNGGAIGVDANHRKIFRRIDVVLSSCQGRRSTALYFGTGDVQQPAATDQLVDSAINDGRDLVGVIHDYEGLPADLTEADLADATSVTEVDILSILAAGQHGWAIRLNAHERMLRNPLVFDHTAYFKTYQPTTGAVECGAGTGLDRIYAMNSCSARPANPDPVTPSAADREVWSGQTEIGSDLMFFTPRDQPVLLSHADITVQQGAALNQRKRLRPGLFFWREK